MFDTHKYIEHLKAEGMSDEQAKAQTEARLAAISEGWDGYISLRERERKAAEWKLLKWILAIVLVAMTTQVFLIWRLLDQLKS